MPPLHIVITSLTILGLTGRFCNGLRNHSPREPLAVRVETFPIAMVVSTEMAAQYKYRTHEPASATMLSSSIVILALVLSAQAAGIPVDPTAKNGEKDWAVFIRRVMDDDMRRVQQKYRNADKWLRGENLVAMPNLTAITEMPKDINALGTAYGIQPLTNYGRDSFYYGAVSIGTKGQVLNVDIDTGSADLWVQSSCGDCTSAQFQPSKSKTFKKTTQKFSIQYGSGSASGTLGHDTVTIAGLTVPDQYFGLVNNASPDFLGTPSSGLIGMAFSSIATSKKPTFFENLMMTNKGLSPLFSVYLTRTSTGAKGSQVCLGCYDRSKVADGAGITWLPVTSKTYWTVGMTGALVNKKAVVPPGGGNLYAAMDTGTTLIYVPNAFAAAIYKQVPGAYLTKSGYYAAPCTSLSSGSIALVFSGQPFVFNIKDFNLGRMSSGSSYCVAGILGLGSGFPSNLAIVGDEFLKSWYSTYDYSNGVRVGLSLSVTAK